MANRAVKTGSALLLVTGVAFVGAFVSEPARAQDQTIEIKAESMSIKAFLDIVARDGGFTFIDEVGVTGDISLTTGKMTPDEALELLRICLAEKGWGIVRTGKFVQIMTTEDLKKRGKFRVVVGKDPEAVPESSEVVTQVIRLGRIKASDAKAAFETLKSREGSSSFVEPSTNTLVVTDTQTTIKRLLSIVKPLDESKNLELTIKPFHLKNTNAEEVAQVIRDLFPKKPPLQPNQPPIGTRQFYGAAGGGQAADTAALDNAEVNVSVERRSNSVIVGAAKLQMELVESTINDLETTAVAIELQVKTYTLKNATPADMASMLQDLYARPQLPSNWNVTVNRTFIGMEPAKDAKAPPTRFTPDPKFTVDARTNALVVTAVKSQMDEIDKLVTQFDSDEFQQGLLVIPLKNGDAGNIARIVTDILNQASYVRPNPLNGPVHGASTTAIAQFQGDVKIVADTDSNSLLVTASPKNLPRIQKLVEDLDRERKQLLQEVRAFILKNASPIDLAQILQDVYNKPVVQGNPWSAAGGTFITRFFGGVQTREGKRGKGPGPFANDGPTKFLPDPRFTVDVRSNAIVVTAIKQQMDEIEQLVKELDADTLEQGLLVVPLRNADAANVARIMTDLLNQARNNAGFNAWQARGGTTTALVALSYDVKIVADADSNSLIVTASPKHFPRIRQMIQDLDRERKQVLLECLVAEVTLDDAGQLGVQWQTNWRNDITNQAGGTSQAGTFGGLGALAQGFQYISTSNKIGLTLQALQTEGKLNVLSSPKILAMENQIAQISVGQDVPFINNSRITQNGDTINTVQYRNVGVILKVTPKINENGEVRMQIHPEVSEIGAASEAVPISNNVTSPVFNDNFADTTVVVNDGETAVLGGLIRNELNENVQKLPILGDIPILGLAFRSKSIDKKKVELLVLVTPHVVDDAEKLRRQSRHVQDKFAMVGEERLGLELETWTRGLDDGSALKAYNRGTVYLEAHRYDEAEQELEQARALQPQDAPTH
ncbi:MAG TPA: secretin N-terminal domain-containing protein, partial [Planctomycetota bacterium]|nr:secretin N-terminal domain-containing protein [Planctomycetota bacterium]